MDAAHGVGWELIWKNGGAAETQITKNHLDDLLPSINASGGVSWLRENGSGLRDVFYWNTSTAQLVATNAAFDAAPQLDNSHRTIFLGYDATNSNWEVYRYVRTALTAVNFTAPTIVRGLTTTGAVYLLAAAPVGGAVVSLTSSDPAVASVPSTVTVPAGLSSATFTVTAGNITATNTVAITAAYSGDTQGARFTTAAVRRVAIYRPGTAEWIYRKLDGTTTTVTHGSSGDQPVPANYLGTALDQMAVRNPSTSVWSIRPDGGGTAISLTWGLLGDQPVQRDYLGYGRAQIAVFRPSVANWIVRDDNDAPNTIVFGSTGDQPMPQDYFQWGRTQVAGYRPSTQEWYVRDEITRQTIRIPFGVSGDQPVPADYLGWGRAQLALHNPTNPTLGEWRIRDEYGRVTAVNLGGASGDKPVPADYLGLGRAQLAFFRPSNGKWYIRADDGTLLEITLGTSTDVPVPGRYVNE